MAKVVGINSVRVCFFIGRRDQQLYEVDLLSFAPIASGAFAYRVAVVLGIGQATKITKLAWLATRSFVSRRTFFGLAAPNQSLAKKTRGVLEGNAWVESGVRIRLDHR